MSNNINYNNGVFQGTVSNDNCYPNYPYPGYYPYQAPVYQPHYVTYPIYQTDPKVIELLEKILKQLESKE